MNLCYARMSIRGLFEAFTSQAPYTVPLTAIGVFEISVV
jgi:hypothetical protein